MKGKILIIDDEKNVRVGFSHQLKEAGLSTICASGGYEGIKIFQERGADLILLDLKMPDLCGIDTLKRLKEIDPGVPVIMISGFGDISNAVQATKFGAYDFLSKPIFPDTLLQSTKDALEKFSYRKNLLYEKDDPAADFGKGLLIKGSIKEIQEIARSDFSIIIQGETGTGKSFLAHSIHNSSSRYDRAFVKMDIGALPETLIESELFGHEKGSFTGAYMKKIGFFEVANGGTIFLDEIENMSPYIQSKLLYVVEDKVVYRVGSSKPVAVDFRLITATNSDIEKSVLENKFRKDLFYRLAEIIITIPPLRERVKDIPFFIQKFFAEACEKWNKPNMKITDGAMDHLVGYSWPGNLRELKTVIRKLVFFSNEEVLKTEHIKIPLYENIEGKEDSSLKNILKTKELECIIHALRMAGGNKFKAASILQTSYRNLLLKIKKHNIENV